ncbi:MAG: GNAT family N-acetyltransferase [Clostridia bacterium]|nr:GNAT family N-acetyltransferase [Clostridia bacterium]MBO4884567.1 GNAT family N-acetyltransferase [Clostridia bacterium]MBR4441680.1 GNAT family N-acetyltransferase [Clostridia bacterium]
MSYAIRQIEPRDDAAVESIIRTCLLEFGGDRPGTAWYDPGLGHFSQVYAVEGRRYWVAEDEAGRVAGGVGIGELPGVPGVCELQKMYCLKEARGTGAAKLLLDAAFSFARGRYRQCYLETFGNMTAAHRFYEKNGFRRIDAPLGSTGHFGCDVMYLKDL